MTYEEMQEGDLVRVMKAHTSLEVDGATIRVIRPDSEYGDNLYWKGKYLVRHPTYGNTEIYMLPEHLERV